MNEVTINKQFFNKLLICYFRYCLTRPDLNAMLCSMDLERFWPDIPVGFRKQIQHDIAQAIEWNNAGDAESIRYWKKVLELKI